MANTSRMRPKERRKLEAEVVLEAIEANCWLVKTRTAGSKKPWHSNMDDIMFYL